MFGLKRSIIPIEISAAAYDEIALAMVNSGATVALVDGALDMREVGLVRGDDPAPLPKHRPISKNTAPGAI
ncbi:MAG: hypothetical protein NUV34_01050 [Sulfuricaulis sp.]|nr:hypothetical protein [Sulfuricaulis sp.]